MERRVKKSDHYRLPPSILSSVRNPDRTEHLREPLVNVTQKRGKVSFPSKRTTAADVVIDYSGDLSRFQSTPPSETNALLYYWGAYLKGKKIWDPCAGGGSMAETLGLALDTTVTATDIRDEYGYCATANYPNIDFLKYRFRPDAQRPDAIIADPPLALYGEFVEQALKLIAIDGADYFVAVRASTKALSGVGRYKTVYKHAPPLQLILYGQRPPIMSYPDIFERETARSKGLRVKPYARSKDDTMWAIWTNIVPPSRVPPLVWSVEDMSVTTTPQMERIYG